MKKYIINFDYKGFLFSAKVFFKSNQANTYISTSLINNEFAHLLEDNILLFIQREDAFQLLLLKENRSFEKLKWNIKAECVDNTQIVDTEDFSLS